MTSPLSDCVNTLIHSPSALANATFNVDFYASTLGHSVTYLSNASSMEFEFDLVGRIIKIVPPVLVRKIPQIPHMLLVGS